MDPVTLRAAATPAAPALLLRPWHMDDIAALVEAAGDADLRRWTSTPVDDAAGGARYVEVQQRGWETGTRLAFAVLEDGRLVGHVALKDVAPGAQAAEVGYWTAAHARGRGVASRALEAVTGWAFATFGAGGLRRLELLHQVDNLGSCRVAEKGGYGYARTLPAAPPAYPRDGHLHVRHA
ncbi:GNAT family N-acetyltransferase [Streptomyces sp. Je 1-79]|uniref:GNAT family N-acetyltransferase n=1 Tax=Streptomyces sp. Je 1-79 TaxID=2943847 RepID=UPI0021A463AC|nr:GNAT family N-acetyltransferase [Streptomyces sp. Je 1-79]MCT4356853.1 GNAT family N-acetyltransferase [Streptomyces sp. Je 1-79]